MKKKVIVIGAGIGGLAAGLRLAKEKYEVEFFEARSQVGGKCETEEIDGFLFEKGPSLLTLPATFRDLFLSSGKRLELMSNLHSLSPAFDYYFADGKKITFDNLSLPNIISEIETKLGKKTANDFKKLMKRAENIWDLSRTPFIEQELKSTWRYFFRKNILTDLWLIKPWLSLNKSIDQLTDSNELKMIFQRYATYSGSDPRKATGALLAIPFMEITFGAWYIQGGLGKIGELAKERAEYHGASFHLNSKVEKILVEAGTSVGVIVNGNTVKADYIISNADAELTYSNLVQDAKLAKSARKLERSFSGFSLYLGLSNKNGENYPKLNKHTIYFPSNYQQEFVELFDLKTPLTDPTIYIFTANSGSDKESWSVLINAPLSNFVKWDEIGEEYAQRILDLLESKGLRVKERLVHFSYRTPADLEREFNTPGGSIYGASLNDKLATFKRPRNTSKIKNLFLVGGSVHPGGGLPLVALSGEMVANAIKELDR
jgi:phytoene desaturase